MKLSPLPSPSLRYDRVGTPEYVACAKPVRRIALKASYTSVYTNYQRLYAFPHVFVFDVTEYEPGAYAAAADDGDGASRDARARGGRRGRSSRPFLSLLRRVGRARPLPQPARAALVRAAGARGGVHVPRERRPRVPRALPRPGPTERRTFPLRAERSPLADAARPLARASATLP